LRWFKKRDNFAKRSCKYSLRRLSADIVENANSGHPGMPIACADIGLYYLEKL
jgi:transketolase